MPRHLIKRKDIISKEEITDMINKAVTSEEECLMALLYLTGARIMEIMNLKRDDIKITETKMFIRIIPLKTRMKEDDVVHYVPIDLSSIFMDKVIRYIGQKSSQDKLFNFSYSSAWRIIKRVNPRAWPHLFRHTRVNKLIEAGANESQLMIWFGWRSNKMPSHYMRRSYKRIENLSVLD